jgi:hypothetical protein
MIDLRLYLGDAMELQVQVMADVVENRAALIQDLNDAIQLGARHSAAPGRGYARKRADLSRSSRHEQHASYADGMYKIKTPPNVILDPRLLSCRP